MGVLEQTLNTCRHLYNQALSDCKFVYINGGESVSYYDEANALPSRKESNPYLPHVHSQVLQDVLKRVDKAFRNFFRRVKRKEKAGYPRFKSQNRYDSFTYPQSGFELGKRLKLSKIGEIKIKKHREIPLNANIKTCTIKREADQWYGSFVVELPDNPGPKKSLKNPVGIDLGLGSIATLSTGEKVENPRWLNQSEKKLVKHSRRLSRKKNRSNNKNKQRMKVAKVHRKIRNQRKDFHHKLNRELVNEYDLIVFENLSIKNMVKNHHLAKSILDANWGQLTNFIKYKAEDAGKIVEFVNPNNTSQECSNCGKMVKKSLGQRMHKCPFCGLIMDRDENAAINILHRGLNTVGITGRACSSSSARDVMTQEAPSKIC